MRNSLENGIDHCETTMIPNNSETELINLKKYHLATYKRRNGNGEQNRMRNSIENGMDQCETTMMANNSETETIKLK